MTLASFRHFCAGARVLDIYEDGRVPLGDAKTLCEEIREAVALSLRTQDVCTPDHQHRLRQEKAFANGHSLAGMVLKALGVTDSGHFHGLTFRHERLYVCQERMEDWQQEVTAYQSPVPLMAAAWLGRCLKEGMDEHKAVAALGESLRCSSLPGIHDPRLHRLMQDETDKSGRLCDLHVHINGSTEFTLVWLHSLRHIDRTMDMIRSAGKGSHESAARVHFFLQQLRVDPNSIAKRLRMADGLRNSLCQLLRTATERIDAKLIPGMDRIQALLHGVRDEAMTSHPFKHPSLPAQATELQIEGLMWFHALKALHKTGDHVLAMLMHIYLLSMNQHLRLLVQQPEQFGFDQFQYITLAGGREAAEHAQHSGFTDRFRQFQGMYGQDMAYVEARFAPKKDAAELKAFLTRIWRDYLAATEQQNPRLQPCSACPRLAEQFHILNGQRQLVRLSEETPRPRPFALGLVAHFIKSKDQRGSCRHAGLRENVRLQAKALLAVRNDLQTSQPALAAALVGKDAASNELDTPPEVFAPTFRYLNRAGISRTTYHAGEDFEHILCGIRAVHEAVTFLDMGSGDRLGHATALGLNPVPYRGKPVHCRKGQWLDNLVWLTNLLESTPQLRAFAGEAFLAQTTIAALYCEIYQRAAPDLPVLWKAWELRRFELKTLTATGMALYDDTRAEQEALRTVEREAGKDLFAEAREELIKYHARENRQRWDEVITMNDEQQPGSELIIALQDHIIRELLRKGIAVEVLPTSNVRISHYHATDEHHVMRWLCPDDPRPAPQVVLGTDDPGIFSTNLRNEYTFILNKLQRLHPGSSEKPYEILRHLIENGMSYRFG